MKKAQIITEKIRAGILSGIFPEGKLPGERELAAEFQVGRCTVRAALEILEAEGLLNRKRKFGTTIIPDIEEHDRGLIGMLLRVSGHVYGDFYQHILSEFTLAGYSVQSIPTDTIMKGLMFPPGISAGLGRAVKKMLANNPEHIILDGYCCKRIPQIEKIIDRFPLMVNFLDGSTEMKQNVKGVWFDFEAIGYMAGKYLLDHGCRRPLLFANYIPQKVRLNREHYQQHREKMIISGFRKAVEEGGLDSDCCVVDSVSASPKDHFRIIDGLTSDKQCLPDGFCGSSDIITIDFLKSYLGDHGRLPEDILFIGIGNTPWSQDNSICPFTSVDMNLEGVAKALVEQAQLPFEKRRDIYIKPILMERSGKRS